MKIGIVTNYSETINYGAILQAYALNTFIHSIGYECETIDFHCNTYSATQKYIKAMLKYKNPITPIVKKLKNIAVKQKLQTRKNAFSKFRYETIKHSQHYNDKNIANTITEYNAFICGSDQIWRPALHTGRLLPINWLAFVPETIPKISYASSIGVLKFDNNRLVDEAKGYLKSFSHISVREKEAKDYLSSFVAEKEISTVLDPVFLLDADHWSELAEEYPIQGNYILTYFIKGDKDVAKDIYKFAQKRNLKVVNFPYMAYEYRPFDIKFSDVHIFDATPNQFLYLMKKAKYVFTDSFHANAFSIIFHKTYYTYTVNKNFSSRIKNINGIAGLENRIIFNADDILKLEKEEINWQEVDKRIEESIIHSKDFLINALYSAEGRI